MIQRPMCVCRIVCLKAVRQSAVCVCLLSWECVCVCVCVYVRACVCVLKQCSLAAVQLMLRVCVAAPSHAKLDNLAAFRVFWSQNSSQFLGFAFYHNISC